MLEILRVDQWLYTLLAGDAALRNWVGDRVYAYIAPPDAAFPFIVFSHQAGYDVRGVGPARIMTSLVYQVKVVGRGTSFAPFKAIADRIDQILQGASGSVVDGFILMCVRERPIAYVETEKGAQYCHLGGLYRIFAR